MLSGEKKGGEEGPQLWSAIGGRENLMSSFPMRGGEKLGLSPARLVK